jgi:hypothetical protein
MIWGASHPFFLHHLPLLPSPPLPFLFILQHDLGCFGLVHLQNTIPHRQGHPYCRVLCSSHDVLQTTIKQLLPIFPHPTFRRTPQAHTRHSYVRVKGMTTYNLEQGLTTANKRMHAVQNSRCCSNPIRKGPTYMSATLRCNGFLRTLFLAIPHVQFSQLVSSNTALELPISHTHPHSITLAPSFLCTISHTHRTFNTNPSTYTRTLLTVPVPYVPTPLHHRRHRWCAMFVGFGYLRIVSGFTV